MNKLTFQEMTLPGGYSYGRATPPRGAHYLDFVVDGSSLREQLGWDPDNVTFLTRKFAVDTVQENIACLLGTGQGAGLKPGRAAIYVCGDCGDQSCGMMTARIEVGTETVTWSDFRIISDIDEDEFTWDGGPWHFTFNAKDYREEMLRALERVASMPLVTPPQK